MTVNHSRGSYEVALTTFEAAMAALPEDCIIVTDHNVQRHWGHLFPRALPVFACEPGEHSKSLDVYERVLAWCADSGASRRTTLAAVGGGVVGDLAGFVSATYMRGIRLVQVPTTLLAQVDAAVGGKVGLDLAAGKNLVGAFYQPVSVYVVIDALSTLDPRQFRNGVAEVVKYGLIMDSELLRQLSEGLLPTNPQLPAIVEKCVSLKAAVVEDDEFERTGRRAILNFGHTIGHAVEKVTGYGPVLHGEAVSIGMAVEARLGEALGVTAAGTAYVVTDVLERQGLPVRHEALQATGSILEAIKLDKKAKRGSLAFSLLIEPGKCKLVEDVPPEAVEAALRG
jgi:3-dehydroquinate synthase